MGKKLEKTYPFIFFSKGSKSCRGMKQLMPIYHVLGTIPFVSHVSNKNNCVRKNTFDKEMIIMNKRHFYTEMDGFYGVYW